MTDEILKKFITEYIAYQTADVIEFIWQGGEPLLAGIDFYKNANRLQKKINTQGKAIKNTLQTNGTLLNEEWCRFFKNENFLIGISLDGPELVHDYYRYDHKKKGTFKMLHQVSLCL